MWLAILAAACSNLDTGPTGLALAASAPSAFVTIGVSVRARSSESPIQGAAVRHNHRFYYTDVTGQTTITVPSGQDTTIEVWAAGYQWMSASGIANSNERWTFYLAANE
jgi:hypothetical protein